MAPDLPPPSYDTVMNNETIVTEQVVVSIDPMPVKMADPNSLSIDTPDSVKNIFIRNLFLVLYAQFYLMFGVIATLMFTYKYWTYPMKTTVFFIGSVIPIPIIFVISFWNESRRTQAATIVNSLAVPFLVGLSIGSYSVISAQNGGQFSWHFYYHAARLGDVCLCAAFIFGIVNDGYLGYCVSLVSVCVLNIIWFLIPYSWRNLTRTDFAASILATIFCVYLILKAHSIVNGYRSYCLTPKEYEFASTKIYINIVRTYAALLLVLSVLCFSYSYGCICS